jgi:predicted O-methyltransferase YrrM
MTARSLSVYMHAQELAQLRDALHAVGPRVALEWGAGGSTAFLLRELPALDKLCSIEHDFAWFASVRAAVDDARLVLRYAPPDLLPTPDELRREGGLWWQRHAEREAAVMGSYVAAAVTFGERFDFVLVDGRARRFCLPQGWALLRPGGVMVLHDAQRPEYADAIPDDARTRFVEPWVQGQICVMTKPAT